jgi:molybdenum cofactor cytidylyltransferase
MASLSPGSAGRSGVQLSPAAVVPAAGAARRMGRPKLLLPYGQGTVLGALVGALHAAGAAPIAVVAAPGDDALRTWCAGPRGADAAGVPLLAAVNPHPELGMLSSILTGLAALGGASHLAERETRLLITPGDLPALRAATVARLLSRQAACAAGLAVPLHAGRRGHPLLIAAPLIPEIERLDPARGLRQLIDLHPGELLEVETDDPGCVADMDTPGDYARLRG